MKVRWRGITGMIVGSLLAVVVLGACRTTGDGADTTVQVATSQTSPAGDEITEIVVYYKLDPRLTGGVQMGERWVTPPTYEIVVPPDVVMEAMAVGTTARLEEVQINPEWSSDDPEVVTITPTQGTEVDMVVMGLGETLIHISAEGLDKTLRFAAVSHQSSIKVTISQ